MQGAGCTDAGMQGCSTGPGKQGRRRAPWVDHNAVHAIQVEQLETELKKDESSERGGDEGERLHKT